MQITEEEDEPIFIEKEHRGIYIVVGGRSGAGDTFACIPCSAGRNSSCALLHACDIKPTCKPPALWTMPHPLPHLPAPAAPPLARCLILWTAPPTSTAACRVCMMGPCRAPGQAPSTLG